MKKLILVLLIGITSLTKINAQQEDSKKEEALESLKIAFLSKQLNLTTEEAQKFWPVYNQYISEMKKMRHEHIEQKGDELEWQQRVLDIKKKYKPEFLKCINQDKFNRLLTADKDWRDKIRQQLEQRKQMNQQSPNRPHLGRGFRNN